MILEHAVLEVLPGREPAFEEAFATAKTLICTAEGFRSLHFYEPFPTVSHYEDRAVLNWEGDRR